MHAEAMSWLQTIRRALLGRRDVVCELGSRDVNGSPRELFTDAVVYVGVDMVEGPGVDVVADAAGWTPDPWLRFDLVVCTEVLEHAFGAPDICANAHRLLRPGGVFVITAAGPKREPHSGIDGGPLREKEFYGNVRVEELRGWLGLFAAVLIDQSGDGRDVYALAIKGRESHVG